MSAKQIATRRRRTGRRTLSVSAAFYKRLQATVASLQAPTLARRDRPSIAGFIDDKVNDALDELGWPHAGGS
jgi:hypothetical protein